MPNGSKSLVHFSRLSQCLLVGCLVAIGVLIILPALNQPRKRRRHPCINRIRSLSLAIINYEAGEGHFPPPYLVNADGQPEHSWRVLILPYLDDPEAAETYKQYRFDEPWNGPHNRRLATRMPKVFRCTDEISKNKMHTSYLAIVGEDTMWPPGKYRRYDEITDGVSKTMLLIEQPDSGIHWMEPRDASLDQSVMLNPDRRLNHQGHLALCAFADGHTRTLGLPLDTEIEMLRGVVTVAGGEEIDPFSW